MLKLNIDMIEQFPVGDSLHLLHLGIVKRLLFGWRDGTFKHSDTKWPAKTILIVSEYLAGCKMPAEINRAVRGLDSLCHWKGTEYRTFLNYIGIVVLKDHLQHEVYEHFLLLFCAVTICSSKRYFCLLPLARQLLLQYIELFKEIYGEQYLTSNVHNLSHLIDDVERFGELDTFSAYPFESMLGRIKTIIRQGNRPLVQVAKRVVEGFTVFARTPDEETDNRVTLSKGNDGQNVWEHLKSKEASFFSKVELESFCLSSNSSNSWFLTKENEIACLVNIMSRTARNNDIELCCVATNEMSNFFTIPIESKHLNIYCTNKDAHLNLLATPSAMKLLNLTDVKCKLVRLKNEELHVFLPLLHTNSSNIFFNDE